MIGYHPELIRNTLLGVIIAKIPRNYQLRNSTQLRNRTTLWPRFRINQYLVTEIFINSQINWLSLMWPYIMVHMIWFIWYGHIIWLRSWRKYFGLTLLPLPYCLLYNWIFSFRHFVILLELDVWQSCYYIRHIGGFWFDLELKSESQNQQKTDQSKQSQDISFLACISEYFINIII